MNQDVFKTSFSATNVHLTFETSSSFFQKMKQIDSIHPSTKGHYDSLLSAILANISICIVKYGNNYIITPDQYFEISRNLYQSEIPSKKTKYFRNDEIRFRHDIKKKYIKRSFKKMQTFLINKLHVTL